MILVTMRTCALPGLRGQSRALHQGARTRRSLQCLWAVRPSISDPAVRTIYGLFPYGLFPISGAGGGVELISISIGIKRKQEGGILLSGFKTDHVPDCTLLSHEYISALCLDAFSFIMVSTQQALILAFYCSKNTQKRFPRQHPRDLWVDYRHSCLWDCSNGEAKSLHSCTEGIGSTQSHCSDRGRDKAVLWDFRQLAQVTLNEQYVLTFVSSTIHDK